MRNENVWWHTGRNRRPGKPSGRLQVWVGTYLHQKSFAHVKIGNLRHGTLHIFKVPLVMVAIWPPRPRETSEPRVRGGRLL